MMSLNEGHIVCRDLSYKKFLYSFPVPSPDVGYCDSSENFRFKTGGFMICKKLAATQN